MNILFVIHYPIFGGPHNQGLLLSRALEPLGVGMTVLLPDEPGNAADRLRSAGVDVVLIPLHRLRATPHPGHQVRFLLNLNEEVKAIRRIIRDREIDVVQVGGLVNPHAAIAARLEGVPVVWQLLDTRPPMALRRVMMPLVLRLSDAVMTTGRAVADVHPGAGKLGERLRPFFPPVEPGLFTPGEVDREAARAEFGFSAEDRVIVSVGNLNPQKGHEILLRSAALARTSEPDAKVLIVGASHDTHRAYEEDLYRLASELGLRVGIDAVFAGARSDVRPALASADVFGLSSVPRSEGAPTAIEEAMMMGLPVVATDVGAVREVVDDGSTGFVVPPLDPTAFSRAVLRILGDDSTRTAFGARGRERALARFTSDECARVHLETYEYVLRTRAASPRTRRGRSSEGHASSAEKTSL
jgi:glycosyltransferase involved in cell wall biosynthesis